MTERENNLLELDHVKELADPAIDDSALEPVAVAGIESGAGLDLAVFPTPLPGPMSVAPGGSRIAYFMADDTGAMRLWLQALDGSAATPLDTDVELIDSGDDPQWSPDGTFLAVTGAHPANGRSAVWIVNVESGTGRLLIDHPASDRQPRWSPDGTTVAFVSERDGRAAISVAAADGLGPAYQLTHAPKGQDDHDPTWATDGTRLVFARRTVEGEATGDHLWLVNIGTGETKQVTKRLAKRHSLSWAPDRTLVIHISDDSEWDNVAVVNPDNAAGWNIASEPGDKMEPRYSKDGGRVLYTRLKDGVVRVCERGASSASAEMIDPGDGIGFNARWLPDKRVVYAHAPATGGVSWYVQEPKTDAERTALPVPGAIAPERQLVTPVFLELETASRKVAGLLYRPSELAGPVPVVIWLGDDPELPLAARFDPIAQALVAHGMAVFAPALPGTAGYGRKAINALKESAPSSEIEVLTILGIAEALREIEGIDKHRAGIAGQGFGGALALLAAGSRPGALQAVAAIDPVTDWDIEFDHARASRREWLARHLGIPAMTRGVYALRTPVTFAAVIDAPLLLIGTDHAPAGRAEQLDGLTGVLRELDAPFEQEVTTAEPAFVVGSRAAAFIKNALLAYVPPPDEKIDNALVPEAV